MADWKKTTFGDVFRGNQVWHRDNSWEVEAIDHTDKPGGSVLIIVRGGRPIQGNPTDEIEVWR